MGSSKRKSSFRIDDILHQQTEQHQHHQLQHNHQQQQQQQINNKLPNTERTSPKTTSVPPPKTTTPSSSSPSRPSSANNQNMDTIFSQLSAEQFMNGPRKPTPVYPQLLDMQKHNFCLPFGMPNFSPAAAYLEQYANALQKGLFTMVNYYYY